VSEKIPIMAMPLPDGGQVVCRVDAVIGATTNMKNDEMTDIYIDVACPEGITIDVDIETFTTSWLSALITPIEELGVNREMH